MFFQKVLNLDEIQAFFDKSNRKLTLAKTTYSMDNYPYNKKNRADLK